METLREVLATVVAPAAIALIVLGSARVRAMRAMGPQAAMAPLPGDGALALAGAYLAVHLALFGELPLPADDRQIGFQHKLAWLVLGVGLASPLLSLPRVPRFLQLVLACTAAVLVARFGLEQAWQGIWGWVGRLLVALGIYIWIVWQDRLAARLPGLAMPAVMATALAGSAVVAVLSRSASDAQRLGGLAAACGGLALLALLQRGTRFSAGAVLVVVLATAGIFIQRWIYDLPLAALGLLVLAFAAPGAVATRVDGEWRRTLVACGLALAACAAAGLVAWSSAPAPNPYG